MAKSAQASEGSGGVGGAGWLGLAKLWFLIAGYALNVALTHLISESTYGQYQTVARAVAVPNMVIIYTVMFAVSRPLSAEYADGCPSYGSIRSRGLKLALALGGVASVVTFLLAPSLASWWDDPSLASAVRVVAPITLIYALYAVNIGTLNALRRFSRQATLDIAMATFKAGLMAGAAALAFPLEEIVAGFTLAAGLALSLSFVLIIGVRPEPKVRAAESHKIAGFAAALIVFTLVLNLLQSIDLLVLSSYSETVERKNAVGYYSSAQLIAWVPYSLMNAVALVAFPLIASISSRGDKEKTARYVTGVAMATLTLLALLSSVAAAAATEIQSLLFPKAYSAAAGHLQKLVLGFSGYSFANTVAWICNSAGHKRAALALVLSPLVTVAALTLTLCPTQHAHGAAVAVLTAGGVAVVFAFVTLLRVFAVRVPLVHVLKLGAAVGAVFLAGFALQVPTAGLVGKLAILGKLSVLTIAFVGVAFGTRAVTIQKLQELRRG